MSTSVLKSKLRAMGRACWLLSLPEPVVVLSTWCPVNCPVNLPGMCSVCSFRGEASEQGCWKHSLPFLKTQCVYILSFHPKAFRNFPIIPQSEIYLMAECLHSQHLTNGHFFPSFDMTIMPFSFDGDNTKPRRLGWICGIFKGNYSHGIVNL